ncbi:MAG: OsmC family protein [Bryobacteraceae bacterium]|jgi:organic hydroperoxide reductase OsmC/OhrA
MEKQPLETVQEFTICMKQLDNFEFEVQFDKERHAPLRMDEPEPLGRDSAPNASRVLAAAIGNCLTASLLFCLRKARVETGPAETRVHVRLGRNERGRLRIAGVEVEIDPRFAPGEREKAARCLELFEDFCVVTQSVREGIPVQVRVRE